MTNVQLQDDVMDDYLRVPQVKRSLGNNWRRMVRNRSGAAFKRCEAGARIDRRWERGDAWIAKHWFGLLGVISLTSGRVNTGSRMNVCGEDRIQRALVGERQWTRKEAPHDMVRGPGG